MRTRKAKPQEPAGSLQMIPVTSTQIMYDECYRGDWSMRWSYTLQSKVPVFQVAAQCGVCGRWWGWVPEAEAAAFKQQMQKGCRGCQG